MTESYRISVSDAYLKLKKQLERENKNENPFMIHSTPNSPKRLMEFKLSIPDKRDTFFNTGRSSSTARTTSRRSDSEFVYPNYIRKDGADYAKIHFCEFPRYEYDGGKGKVVYVNSRVKAIHHTIYNSEEREIVLKSPEIKVVNQLMEKKHKRSKSIGAGLTLDYRTTTIPFNSDSKRTSPRDFSMNTTSNWTTREGMKFLTTKYESHGVQIDTLKLAKIVQRHEENEKKFEKTLNVIDKISKEKLKTTFQALDTHDNNELARVIAAKKNELFSHVKTQAEKYEERKQHRIRHSHSKYDSYWTRLGKRGTIHNIQQKPQTPAPEVEEEQQLMMPMIQFQTLQYQPSIVPDGEKSDSERSPSSRAKSPSSRARTAEPAAAFRRMPSYSEKLLSKPGQTNLVVQKVEIDPKKDNV